MRTGFHLFGRSWKTASGTGKQNQANVSGFLFDPYNTIYYHKNPYNAVSSGHKLGTVNKLAKIVDILTHRPLFS